jgi:hypothetical protein
MIPKLILSGSYDFGDPSVSLVPLHRRGVDHQFIQKVAGHSGCFHKELSDLKPVDGHTVFHILAVGNQEAYGYNRNCDGFSRGDNKTAHVRFKENGHVFRNHKNWDPQFKTGSVLATAHNDDMDRIELLVALQNSKYAEELEAAENGEDIPFSMGSQQEYDVCSHCGHKAPTAKDHCDHIKNHLGEVLRDGTKIAMDNPDPHYFDISTVHKPADRIAYSLRKVASDTGVVGGHDLAEIYGVRGYGQSKQAVLVRLAEMEKRFEGMGKKVTSPAPKSLAPSTVKALKHAAAIYGTDVVLGTLHRTGHMLGFSDFCEIVVGESKLAHAGQATLVGGFQRLLSDTTDVTSLDGSQVKVGMVLGEQAEADLHLATSMAPEAIQHRALRGTIVTLPHSLKVSGLVDPVYQRGISDFYLHYKLAFCTHPQNCDNLSLLQAVALSNVLHA